MSIAIVLWPGTSGVSLEAYRPRRLGREYTKLEYWQIGLRDLRAAEYLEAGQDVAIAMAALMQPGEMGKAALKFALLRRLQRSTLDQLIDRVLEAATLDESLTAL